MKMTSHATDDAASRPGDDKPEWTRQEIHTPGLHSMQSPRCLAQRRRKLSSTELADEGNPREAKIVRELLKGVKYSIDYYQREYKWQGEQICELVDDLGGKFLEEFQPAFEKALRQSIFLPRFRGTRCVTRSVPLCLCASVVKFFVIAAACSAIVNTTIIKGISPQRHREVPWNRTMS